MDPSKFLTDVKDDGTVVGVPIGRLHIVKKKDPADDHVYAGEPIYDISNKPKEESPSPNSNYPKTVNPNFEYGKPRDQKQQSRKFEPSSKKHNALSFNMDDIFSISRPTKFNKPTKLSRNKKYSESGLSMNDIFVMPDMKQKKGNDWFDLMDNSNNISKLFGF